MTTSSRILRIRRYPVEIDGVKKPPGRWGMDAKLIPVPLDDAAREWYEENREIPGWYVNRLFTFMQR